MPVCVVRDELNAEWENRFVSGVVTALFFCSNDDRDFLFQPRILYNIVEA